MSLTSAKASTQDSTNGTPVALAVNEDSGTNLLQAGVQVGNKTTWAEVSRTALTAADAPTGGNVTNGSGGFGISGTIDCGNALAVNIRATCGTASAVLTGYLILYDKNDVALGQSETVAFTSHATLRLGNASGDFISQRVIVDLGRANHCKFFVASVSAGTWAVYVNPI